MLRKVALVTGGASGIGKGIARRLAEDGYEVVIADRNSSLIDEVINEITASSGSAYKEVIDVSDEQAINELFQSWSGRYGRLDVLVNNAATNKPKSLIETEPVDWDFVMDVNLKSVYLFSRGGYPFLKESQGAVVNISSIMGQQLLSSGNTSYGVSKAGVNYLTRVLAKEWLKDHIRVNAIVPAAVDTPLLRAGLSEEGKQSLEDSISKGMIQTPEQIAGVVSLFLRPEASIITGTCLVADGGSQLV
ncbi:SDR family NAD(P)-dependent oxidoreductase [Paenibacillus sp. Soil787]|uniref:SDR family NAD(P)-dependent oxidoreductase n=1 Tax=Paenibacillus sp. Soil787 TaxID=1736411 RepID=UPI0006F969F3|nr:SDR family oxidoreductase [Paenibacillus sp. Soil787]KRF44165.1 hypothetical protein ASG93_04460 [Paenibacillus sp. Soil787]